MSSVSKEDTLKMRAENKKISYCRENNIRVAKGTVGRREVIEGSVEPVQS